MTLPLSNDLEEVRDRVRRIESRLTAYMLAQGFDAGVTKPAYIRGGVTVPSLGVSLADILRAIPPEHKGRCPVVHRQRFVCEVTPNLDFILERK